MKDTMRKGPAMLSPGNDEMDWKAITGSAFVLGNSMCVISLLHSMVIDVSPC